eukprot:455826_1
MGNGNNAESDLFSDLTFEEIEGELNKKRKETTMLFVGLPKSGKSTIIANIVKRTSKYEKHIFTKFSYELKSFTVNEYTDKTIKKFSSNSYKHLKLIHQFAPKYRITKNQLNKILSINQFKENNESCHSLRSIDGNAIDYELLFYGYIRKTQRSHNKHIYLNISEDIINLIKSFTKRFITAHKIKSNKIYNLWDLKYVNRKNLETWKELFQYINVLVFVCDISQYQRFH